MNKKQKALVILWCLITAVCGFAVVDASGESYGPYRSDLSRSLASWITSTLVVAALFWMFAEKNWHPKTKASRTLEGKDLTDAMLSSLNESAKESAKKH